MAKEYNRANGDLFEKAIIICHNLAIGYETYFNNDIEQTQNTVETTITKDEYDISCLELILQARDTTESRYGTTDADVETIKNLAIKINQEDLFQEEEVGKKIWTQCGQHTRNSIGDIDLGDGKLFAEAKYVSCGTGTYHQTSIRYFEQKLNLKPYAGSEDSFLYERGYYDELQKIFEKYNISYSINPNNISPINRRSASDIRNCEDNSYDEIEKLEYKYRSDYVSYIKEQLSQSSELVSQFYNDMLSKKKLSSPEDNKTYVPDFLIVGNHVTEEVNMWHMKNLKWYLCESNNIEEKNQLLEDEETNTVELSDTVSFNLGGIRVTFSWKNGVGLNNPALYVFLQISNN